MQEKITRKHTIVEMFIMYQEKNKYFEKKCKHNGSETELKEESKQY